VRSFFHSFLVCGVALVAAAQFVRAQQTYPLWPDSFFASGPSQPETDTTTAKDDLVAGKRVARITGVTHPSIALYSAPARSNSGVAVVVFPGGGYRILAYDLEGTEVCTWLNSIGVTCVLLKYRVPNAGPYPAHPEALADAQRAIRLTRQRAAEWKLDPERIGVLGFSAGGHLAAAISNHFKDQVYSPIDATDQLSAKPDFAFVIYPGYLAQPANRTQIEPSIAPSASTPPTFLLQAEDDPVHVENTLVYYAALKDAKVPAEMHVYAHGGHGYGLRPTELPITHWPTQAAEWLHTIGMLKEPAQSR
jgi:acetyl esterase/lipase